MDDMPIDIGVFARVRDGKEDDEKVLYLEKAHVADGDSTLDRGTVDERTVRSRHRSVQQAGRPRFGRQPQAGRVALKQERPGSGQHDIEPAPPGP